MHEREFLIVQIMVCGSYVHDINKIMKLYNSVTISYVIVLIGDIK